MVLKEPSPQLLYVALGMERISGWEQRIGAVEGGSAVWVLGMEREKKGAGTGGAQWRWEGWNRWC